MLKDIVHTCFFNRRSNESTPIEMFTMLTSSMKSLVLDNNISQIQENKKLHSRIMREVKTKIILI